MKGSDVVHVRMENPVARRKEVLKTAIGSTKLLYSFNELMDLREKELKLMNKLRIMNKTMKTIVHTLDKELLPELPSAFIHQKEVHHAKEVHSIIHHKKKPKVQKDDVKDLLQELKDVEKQLKDLKI